MGEGWSAPRRIDDLDDIDAWMAQRNVNVALRQQAETVGRDLWDQATRNGQDLSAAQPSDLVALGADALGQKHPAGFADSEAPSDPGDNEYGLSQPQPGNDPTVARLSDPGPIVRTPPSYGFAMARPGDSISRLLGTSDPAAIGRFVSLNGLNGRNSTLQIGHSYAVPTRFDDASPDEIATGNHMLRADRARLAGARVQAANDAQADRFGQRLNSGLNVWTGEAPDYAAPSPDGAPLPEKPWWDRSEIAKGLAGEAGLRMGRGLGGLRGGVNLMGSTIRDFGLLTRVAMPPVVDEMFSPPGMSARQQVASEVGHGLQYVDRVRADPHVALDDLKDFGNRAAIDLIPAATPQADTVLGEFGRNLRVGANQGELGINLAMLPFGGEGVEGISALRAAPKLVEAADFEKPYPSSGPYFAAPDTGRGHHFFSQNQGYMDKMGGVQLPKFFTNLPIPTVLRESPLFRLHPEGFSRARMLGLHFQVDPNFNGGAIPIEYGGGVWRGADLGLEKLPPAARIWHGAPRPLKVAVGAGAGAGLLAGSAGYSYLDDWSQR